MECRAYEIPARGVRSLAWLGDRLVDWISGGEIYSLDGAKSESSARYAYRFDSAVTSPSGRFAVLYEKLGTKGILLKNGEVTRELSRSFYHADAYEYPICLFSLADGREVVAHCPNEYNRLEIDELETGTRLTSQHERSPSDLFHSRLSVSPSGARLLSAGWVWHPFGIAACYELESAVRDGRHLDKPAMDVESSNEVSSCAFVTDDEIVAANSDDFDYSAGDEEEEPLRPLSIGIWSLERSEWSRLVHLEAPAGTLMPLGKKRVLLLHTHPRLLDLETGEIQREWTNISTGLQTCSIIHHIPPVPPMAIDVKKRRFAVASEEAISVLDFGESRVEQ